MKVNTYRKPVNEVKNWQSVRLFNKFGVFTPERIQLDKLPEGYYAYECRHYDEDWGLCCEIAPRVLVNFMGTVVVNEKLPIDFDIHWLMVRNGEEEDEPFDGSYDFELGDEHEDDEEFAHASESYEEYLNEAPPEETEWVIPYKCIHKNPSTLYIDEFNDDTLETIKDCLDYTNIRWKSKIIIDINPNNPHPMSAKEINKIRDLMYHVRDAYVETSSMYSQTRIKYVHRPLTASDIKRRYADIRAEVQK
jgi:hypothetical protein